MNSNSLTKPKTTISSNLKRVSISKKSIRRSIKLLNKISKYHTLCLKAKKMSSNLAEVPKTPKYSAQTPSQKSKLPTFGSARSVQTKIPLKTSINQTPSKNLPLSKPSTIVHKPSLVQTNLLKTPSSSLNRLPLSTQSARKQLIPPRTPSNQNLVNRGFNSARVSRIAQPSTPSNVRTNLASRFGSVSKTADTKTNYSNPKTNTQMQTPNRRLIQNDKKISRTIDFAKSIKRRSIKILNQSSSRLSFLNEMESGCLIVTPNFMRELINTAAANKIKEVVKEEYEKEKIEQENELKIHSVKPVDLIKYFLNENKPNKIEKVEKEPIKVEIIVKINENEAKNEFKQVQVEVKHNQNEEEKTLNLPEMPALSDDSIKPLIEETIKDISELNISMEKKEPVVEEKHEEVLEIIQSREIEIPVQNESKQELEINSRIQTEVVNVPETELNISMEKKETVVEEKHEEILEIIQSREIEISVQNESKQESEINSPIQTEEVVNIQEAEFIEESEKPEQKSPENLICKEISLQTDFIEEDLNNQEAEAKVENRQDLVENKIDSQNQVLIENIENIPQEVKTPAKGKRGRKPKQQVDSAKLVETVAKLNLEEEQSNCENTPTRMLTRAQRAKLNNKN